jgi:hypothetical protein
MSFTDTDVIARFDGNGSDVAFALNQGYFNTAADEIKVYIVDTSVTPNTQTLRTEGVGALQYAYTGGDLTLVPPALHTTVTFVTAPISTDKVVIVRDSAIVQEDTLAVGTSMATAEVSLNKLAALIQELDAKVQRALKFRITSEEVDQLVPDAVALKLMAWNSAGTALELISRNAGLTTGTYRAARESLADTETSKAVTFSSAFADTNYTVVAVMENTTDSSVDYQPVTITAKSTTGFTAEWNAGIDGSNYSLAWYAMEDA